jgi:small subunit ribosomal protein S25e
MGGTKKKSIGASEKTQDAGPQASEVKKEGKKDKKEKGAKGQQQKAKISVVLNEGQGMKALADLKAITPHALARSTGVKISIANAFIKSLEAKGTIRSIGGYSGHKVYALAQQMKVGDLPQDLPKELPKREAQPAQEAESEESATAETS